MGATNLPMAPLFQRGVTEDLPGFVWSTRNCRASHTRRVQTEFMGKAPALAGGSGSGFRPTSLPVGLHRNQERECIWQN